MDARPSHLKTDRLPWKYQFNNKTDRSVYLMGLRVW
jgi:hypothetical protein